MRFGGIGLALLAVAVLAAPLYAQSEAPSASLSIQANQAFTWSEGETNIVQLEGPVTIQIDQMQLTAKQAVIWITPESGEAHDVQQVDIALIGEAKIQRGDVIRSGDTLRVDARVRGPIRITAEERLVRNLSASQLYIDAAAIRAGRPTTAPSAPGVIVRGPESTGLEATTEPTSQPTTRAARRVPVTYRGNLESLPTAEGKVALALTGGVVLSQTKPNGDVIELQADRAVLFTTLEHLRDVADVSNRNTVEESIVAAYLEGDVRINLTPDSSTRGEQRLEGNRVYYDFVSDRAVLTDAVIHTMDPDKQIPLIVRAKLVRQLSEGEWQVNKAALSTSSFAVPSYSIRADKAYIRQEETGDPRYGNRTSFFATHATLDAYNLPIFYFPVLAGSMTDRGMAIRNIEIGSSRNNGFGVRTEWGLFEALGLLVPPDLDASVHLDYYALRGAGVGVDGRYGGGFITQTTKQPWNFQGDFKSYIVFDHGIDDPGRDRAKVDPNEAFRGRIRWDHQHFFPDDWQVQLRTGWSSDPTFLEEWFPGEYDQSLPLESSAYVKHQRDSEAFTLLVTTQPNNFVTSSEFVQEQFEIERLPELGYHRIGDSLWNDRLTFFSDDTFSALKFQKTSATLREQGFRPNSKVTKAANTVLPGQPAEGLIGALTPPDVPETTDYRGDFRQELDYPFSAGEFRIVPYIVGRYTAYSDSPDGGSIDRFYAGGGARISTMFWKIDDTVHSDFLDIHRIRHVVEPELHVFTGAQNTDPDQLFIYDEPIDNIHDISGMSLALHQRWQTKRGGIGNERSVDFFVLNVSANFFNNAPPDDELAPVGFRGLFFPSLPEASIPRDSINADALWRVSDSTVLLGDMDYNISESNIATASIGLAVRRDTRLSYFLGTRYIEVLNSNITSVIAEYELTQKYSVQFRESFDFGQKKGVYSSAALIRHFDRFYAMFSVFNDTTQNNSGFSIAIYPEGLGRGSNVSTGALQNVLGP